MLNQKLAEILILRQLFGLPWPSGLPRFVHEPEGTPGGRRPELLVEDSDRTYVFEVKAPALLPHIIERGNNPMQVPGRIFNREDLERLADGRPITMPRDNPIKDFLISAESKFAPFKAVDNNCHTTLVIVWDDFVYEPICSLTSEEAQGLLTDNSFARDSNGRRLVFENVDAIVIVRHLSYFIHAARNEHLVDREHAFDFGDEHALPNVLIPVSNASLSPAFVTDGMRAVLYSDPRLRRMAEYNPPDAVLWFEVPVH